MQAWVHEKPGGVREDYEVMWSETDDRSSRDDMISPALLQILITHHVTLPVVS